MDVLTQLVEFTIANIGRLFNEGYLTDKMVSNYGEMSKKNLHSWLQYVVICSGECLNLISAPEIKIHYMLPIDPATYGLKRKTKVYFKKVDVAFYSDNILEGFAEIITMDEAHGAISSDMLKEPWLSPRDSLLYLSQNSILKPKFCLIVNAFPKLANSIPWVTIEAKHEKLIKTRDYYTTFIGDWQELVKELNKNLDTKMITLVNSNEIHVY